MRYPLVSRHFENFLKCFEHILVAICQTVLLYCKKHLRVAGQSSSHVRVFRIHLMTVNVVAEVAQDIQGDNHHAKSLFTWKTLPFTSIPWFWTIACSYLSFTYIDWHQSPASFFGKLTGKNAFVKFTTSSNSWMFQFWCPIIYIFHYRRVNGKFCLEQKHVKTLHLERLVSMGYDYSIVEVTCIRSRESHHVSALYPSS